MTIKVLFKDGCYVEYTDIQTCAETILYSGYMCLDAEDEAIYLNMNEIIFFKIKEEQNEDNKS